MCIIILALVFVPDLDRQQKAMLAVCWMKGEKGTRKAKGEQGKLSLANLRVNPYTF